MIPNLNRLYKNEDDSVSLIEYPDDLEDFSKLCSIRSGQAIIPFQLYDYQASIAKIIDSHRFTQIFKTRQLGLTEMGGVRSLHKAVTDKAYAGVFLSIGQKESSNISKRIKLLNNSLNIKWATESTTELQPLGGGNIKCRPSTANSVRGLESVTDVFFDEAAFIEGIEEIYAGAMPSQEMVGDMASTVICSTMSEDGELSWFWKLLDSNNGDIDAREVIEGVKNGLLPPFFWWTDVNGWAKVIIHWKAHPIYSKRKNYLKEIKKKYQIPDAKVEREYNLGIPESGGMLFNKSIRELCNYGEWKTVTAGSSYVFTIDPNFGGDDYFCLLVWDISNPIIELVHEFAVQRESVKQYCIPKVISLYQIYQPVLIGIEGNSGGTIIAEYLEESCPNTQIEITITTQKTKIIYTDRIAFMYEDLKFLFPNDWAGFNEMLKFSLKNREAAEGHDDRITSWMILGAVYDMALNLIGVNFTMNRTATNEDLEDGDSMLWE